MMAMKNTWLKVPALILFGPLLLHGHQGDRIYPILEITEKSKIDLKDGVVDDWVGLFGEPTFTALDFTAFDSFWPGCRTQSLRSLEPVFFGSGRAGVATRTTCSFC